MNFLQSLRAALKTRISPRAQLVWYDSVLFNGQLKWQNELNAFNRHFAELVDAFYVNYNWTRRHLQRVERFLERKQAKVRRSDVFFGVDVFGRGSFAGGRWNSGRAVQAAKNFGFSAAVFAPGWTTECFGQVSENFL